MDRRAPSAPPQDRMMGRAKLVDVAECEMCKAIMPFGKVHDHLEVTGHHTYNLKTVTQQDYMARIGRLK